MPFVARMLSADLSSGDVFGQKLVEDIVLSIPLFRGAILLENTLNGLGFSVAATPTPSFLAANGTSEIVLAFVVAVAMPEEPSFWSYLTPRSRTATASSAAALPVSAAISFLEHGYEGSAG
jgi:hypothetical protein